MQGTKLVVFAIKIVDVQQVCPQRQNSKGCFEPAGVNSDLKLTSKQFYRYLWPTLMPFYLHLCI